MPLSRINAIAGSAVGLRQIQHRDIPWSVCSGGLKVGQKFGAGEPHHLQSFLVVSRGAPPSKVNPFLRGPLNGVATSLATTDIAV
jgi:hypothetical protein